LEVNVLQSSFIQTIGFISDLDRILPRELLANKMSFS
jgi:hypothetical protein